MILLAAIVHAVAQSVRLQADVQQHPASHGLTAAQYRAAVDTLPIGVVYYRIVGRDPSSLVLVDSNATASAMLGRDLIKEVGRPIFDVFPTINTEEGRSFIQLWIDANHAGKNLEAGVIRWRDTQGLSGRFYARVGYVDRNLVAYSFTLIEHETPSEHTILKYDSRVVASERLKALEAVIEQMETPSD